MKRCQRGDPEAWRTFLPPFQDIGRRALRSFRLSASDSEDILSETLTTLYAGALARFRGDTVPELVVFVKTIVRNRAIDFVKHRNRWTPAEGSPVEGRDDAVAQLPTADAVDTLGRLSDDECVELLRQEVETLKRDDRELYLMKARGMKEREIAEQLGRPPGTVASQIARLLDRLRARLKDRGCV